jgi:hypothetical protein
VNGRHGDSAWFWEKAGVAVQGMIPAALNMLEETKLGAPVGETTYITYGLVTPGKQEKPRIVWDSRLLHNPYFARYLIAGGDLLVVDQQETDLWKLVGGYVAMLQQPADADRVEEVRRKLDECGLSKYPILEQGRNDTSALYSGWLKTSRTEDATIVTLESRTSIGLTTAQIVAVEVEAKRGEHGKARIQIPYFAVLGRIVAWVDMKNKSLPAGKDAQQQPVAKPKTRGRRNNAVSVSWNAFRVASQWRRVVYE